LFAIVCCRRIAIVSTRVIDVRSLRCRRHRTRNRHAANNFARRVPESADRVREFGTTVAEMRRWKRCAVLPVRGERRSTVSPARAAITDTANQEV
jgi:hypothetical protein